jgi:hypothetical protein
MNSYSTVVRALARVSKPKVMGLAATLLVAGLAGCSRPPEHSGVPAMSAVAIGPTAAPGAAAQPEAEAVIVAPKAKPAVATTAVRPGAAPAVAPAATKPVAEPVKASSARVPTLTQAGRVLDESGQPLVGATVLLRGTTRGTSTDATGGYSLQVPAGDNILVVGYGGYEDEIATTHNAQPLTVTLLPKAGASVSSAPVPSPKAKGRRIRQ